MRSSWLSLLLALGVLAQDAPAPKAPALALQEGARWRYQQNTIRQGHPLPGSTIELTDEGAFALPNGRRCHQLRVEHDDTTTFEYWSLGDDGIRQHRSRAPGHRGELDPDATPALLLALPITADDRWQWQEGNRDQPIDQIAELLATATPIDVRAGRFTTTHVRITARRGDQVLGTRELWFAPVVGIVRDDRHGDGSLRRRELVDFQAGRDVEAERDRRLRANIVDDPTLAATGPPWIGWLRDGAESLALPGRFAVIKNDGKSLCCYVDDQRVHRIVDLGNAANWSNVDLRTRRDPRAFDQTSPTALARAIARLHAERCNMAGVEPVGVITRNLTAPLPPDDEQQLATVEFAAVAPDLRRHHVTVLVQWLPAGRRTGLGIAIGSGAPSPTPFVLPTGRSR
ncbi:MAG: hypothetical protein IPK26_07195 [Planctomycetes bacterium]|nr:hypothetical protein [Planctomycetota bacterium]